MTLRHLSEASTALPGEPEMTTRIRRKTAAVPSAFKLAGIDHRAERDAAATEAGDDAEGPPAGAVFRLLQVSLTQNYLMSQT